jgi:hypothetical protein
MENIVKNTNSTSSLMESVSANAPVRALQQTIVKGGTTEQLFALMQRAISNNPVEVIVTPRVDKGSNAYYWVGVRFESRELDFKLPVNQQIKDYILSYLRRGNVALPEVTDFEPEAGIVDVNQWILDHEAEHEKYAMHKDEQVSMSNGKNYLKLRLKYHFGKIIYPAAEVEDILSLIMQVA